MIKSVYIQRCIPHTQPADALDLSLSVNVKDQYLCQGCLAYGARNKSQVLLIKDAHDRSKEMKLEKLNQKKQLIEHHQQKLFNLQKRFTEFQQQFTNNLNDIIKLIGEQIVQANIEKINLTEPNFDIFEEQDVIDLKNYINSGFTENIEQINQKEYSIMEKIQNQMKKIIKLNTNLLTQNQTPKCVTLGSQENPFLLKGHKIEQPLCQRHNQEFFMANLEPGQFQQRLYCVYCIEEIKSKQKLTSLVDVQSLWQKHKLKAQESYQIFFKSKLEQQKQIKQIIKDSKKQISLCYKELIKEMDQISNEIISTSEVHQLIQQDNKQLFQLEIENFIDQFSQNTQMNETLKGQENYSKLKEQQYSKEIFKKIFLLQQKQQEMLQLLTQQINFCFENAEELGVFFNYFFSEFFKSLIKKLSIEKIQLLFLPNLQALHNFIQVILKEAAFVVTIQHQNINNQKDLAFEDEEKIKQIQNLSQKLNWYKKVNFDKIDQQSRNSNSFHLRTQHINIKHKLQIRKHSKFSINQLIGKEFKVFNINFNYGKELQFSKIFKHESISISSGGRKATKGNDWLASVCICNQPLPKNGGVIIIELKIITTTYMFVGMCFKDYVQPTYIFDNYEQVGHGYYFLCSNGFYCSHHELENNNFSNGFKYYSGDIIQMEINMKNQTITWKNKYRLQSCTMRFSVEKDLFVCCLFKGFAEVQLL